MKVILWAETMANGFYPCYPTSFETPKEVWADFYSHIAEAGNVILGRKTVDEVIAAGSGFGSGDALVVSVSRNPAEVKGAKSAESPRAALEIVRSAGHQTAFVGGGANILNSFLADDLANELVLLVAPAIGGRESLVALPEGQHRPLRLLSYKELGSGVLKLHYSLDGA
jgi:riboflavin biosynthesis pyrimidine reductase